MSLIDLHAGGVVRNGFATLFVGPNGAGKSTVVTLLLSRGFSFLSDDNISLDLNSKMAYPATRSIFLREDASTLFTRSIREKLIQHPNGVWQFDDDELDRFRCWDPAPIRAIVILDSRRTKSAELIRIGQLEAITHLLRQCRSFEELGPKVIPLLAQLVKNSQLFRLSPGSLKDTAWLLKKHLP